MTQQNVTRLKVYAWDPARDRRVDAQELSALQQRAMRTAAAFGCEAGVEVMDFVASDPPRCFRLKIVVVRRDDRGQLLCHESTVVVLTNELTASVGEIVRDGAAKLAERCTSASLAGSEALR